MKKQFVKAFVTTRGGVVVDGVKMVKKQPAKKKTDRSKK